MVLHVLDVVVQQQVQTRPVAVADARRQAELVDEQLGGVEDARRLGEELVLRRAVGFQVRLVQRARRFLDREVARPAATAAARATTACAVAPIDRDSFIVSPARFSRPPVEVLPDPRREEVELPPLHGRDEAGPEDRPAAEVQLRLFADVSSAAGVAACQNVSHPKCFARLAFGKRQML